MEDEEAIFDPSLKKKKKKKTGYNLDGALAEGLASPAESAPQPAAENGEDTEPKDDADMDDDEMFGKKKVKKKKKTKPFQMSELSDVLPEKDSGLGGETGEDTIISTTAPADLDDLDLDMDFSKAKKKKPKKKTVMVDGFLAVEEALPELDSQEIEGGEEWLDSDRDYNYDELLLRALNQLREKNPDMATGDKKKFVMKTPQVVRIGSKKSAFVNFADICRLLHRVPKHLLQFLLAELGTSGSIDGNNQLIIKGRFQQKQIENVLRRYIKEYVTCHTCRSPDTILQKDARLYFLQCEQCNSRCSVAPIKSGFQAVANKQQRQAIRASKN